MKQKDITEFTDEELLQEAKKMKSAVIIDAVLIGFLIGIVCYSILRSNVGVLTFVPVYFAYKLITRPKYKKQELESLLKERNLK